MKFQYKQTVKFNKVLYVLRTVKNLLRVSRLMLKGATMGANQYKITTKKNGGCVIFDARKGQNKIIMFYLKAKRYDLEGKEGLTNPPEEKKDDNNEK